MRLFAVLLLFASATSLAQITHFETAVEPLANEDIAYACHYELALPAATQPIRAVWVIFDRGSDVHDLFSDPEMLNFARRFQLALLLHGLCPGKAPADHEDMNMDPSNGLGPALFRSLSHFARATGHRELLSAKLVFLGFSGAGPLSARLAASNPDRTIAAILSAPGHYDPMGIDNVNVSAKALGVPEMILAGGGDSISGTVRPYQYFRKGRDQGAAWIFVLQNNSPHCCTGNAKHLILAWLEAIIEQRCPTPGNKLLEVHTDSGWVAFMRTTETATKDSFGLDTFNIVSATVRGAPQSIAPDEVNAGWLPNHAVALEWLSFVQQTQHPILPR